MEVGIIYCWRNIHNGKRYIGQTINPKKRYNDHKRHLGNYDGPNLFGRALNKYSLMDDWEYTVIEEVPTSQLDTREIYWIAFYDSMNPECGYNTCEGGHNSYGYKLPEETCKKMSESKKGKTPWNKGKKTSEETCKKISEANKGRKRSPETCRKISESERGKKLSHEARKNMSNAHNPNRIAIYQNDTLITVCDTIAEATHIAGVSYHVVIRITSGRRTSKTKNGFTFKYVNKTQPA